MSASTDPEDWLTVWNDRTSERADWNGFEACFASLDDYLAYVSAVVEVVTSTLAITEDDTVLDLGCGTGRVSSEIAARASSVVGVDFSRTALRVARETRSGSNLRYMWANLNTISTEELPVVDKAYAVGSLYYLDSVANVWRIIDALLESGTRVLLLDLPDAEQLDPRDRDYDTSRFRHLRFHEQEFTSRYGNVTILRGLFDGYVNDPVRFSVHIDPTSRR